MIGRKDLAAWAAGALDPARREEVDAAIAVSSSLRREAEALKADLAAIVAPPAAWRVPPPGLGLAVVVTPVAVLDAAPSRVRVELPSGAGPVVLLQRDAGEWQVVAVLQPTPSVDLAVGHEWGIALAAPGWDAEADARAAYAGLREGIARGTVPVTSVRS